MKLESNSSNALPRAGEWDVDIKCPFWDTLCAKRAESARLPGRKKSGGPGWGCRIGGQLFSRLSPAPFSVSVRGGGESPGKREAGVERTAATVSRPGRSKMEKKSTSPFPKNQSRTVRRIEVVVSDEKSAEWNMKLFFINESIAPL